MPDVNEESVHCSCARAPPLYREDAVIHGRKDSVYGRPCSERFPGSLDPGGLKLHLLFSGPPHLLFDDTMRHHRRAIDWHNGCWRNAAQQEAPSRYHATQLWRSRAGNTGMFTGYFGPLKTSPTRGRADAPPYACNYKPIRYASTE